VIETWTLYFDGACWPNPGLSGSFGYHLHHNGELIASVSGIVQELGEKSNNCAEYAGLCAGLKDYLDRKPSIITHLNVYGDSQLVIKQMSGRWKIKDNNVLYTPYARRAQEVCKQIRKLGTKIIFTWIPREHNEEADRLSKLHMEEK
jgi:ribonuclease HI